MESAGEAGTKDGGESGEKRGKEGGMEIKWRQWIGKKGLEKWFRRDNLLILILAGILLFIIALPTKDGGEKGGNKEEMESLLANGETAPQDGETGSVKGAANVSAVDSDYTAELERRLTDALSDMADVGRVKVMVTLKSSSELVVEREEPVSRSVTTETDSLGGSRTVNQSDTGETVVYRTDGSYSEPYVVKSYAPEIEGVLVVAQGAGTGTVNRTVTDIVTALFGIEAHKVKVVKMDAK